LRTGLQNTLGATPEGRKPRVVRRLAAIMFSDMVGYTSLAQKDEALAINLLKQYRSALRSCFSIHSGKEIKTMGDGFLVEFGSALEAVECALSIHTSLDKKNLTLTPDKKIQVRIGIHLGDVVHEGGDLYGDSVNVASRIEPLAGPGEIYITQQVYDQIRNRVGSPVELVGKLSVKNVEQPVEVYKVLPSAGKIVAAPFVPTMGHRIVILPFANISPSNRDEYFADGMTEELISAVAKVSGLRVISRTSAMKYKGTNKSAREIARELNSTVVLEGSVRKAGNKLRISVKLIDVQKDEYVWSQSYDRELEDVFAIQGDIASSVAQTLQVRLLSTEKQSIEKKATEDISAYNLYLKGLHFRNEGTERGIRRAIKYFDEAMQKDSRFALAYAALADCYFRLADDGILPAKEGYPKAEKLASRALQLDEAIPEAHATLGAVLEDYYWDFRGAEREFTRALGLSPSYGRVCKSYGVHLALMGKLDQAVVEIRRAQALNPIAMDLNECASVVFDYANQYEDSLQACRTMLRIDEEYFPAYLHLSDAQAHKALFDEALLALKKALKISNGELYVKGRIAHLHAISGNQAEARKILADLEDASKRKHLSPITFARIYCGLGEKDKALNWLERAYEERDGGVIFLKGSWVWESLRSSKRFKRLLKKIGFEDYR
jgi:TolB-like protein/Flp pilus assembly protein TadD